MTRRISVATAEDIDAVLAAFDSATDVDAYLAAKAAWTIRHPDHIEQVAGACAVEIALKFRLRKVVIS